MYQALALSFIETSSEALSSSHHYTIIIIIQDEVLSSTGSYKREGQRKRSFLFWNQITVKRDSRVQLSAKGLIYILCNISKMPNTSMMTGYEFHPHPTPKERLPPISQTKGFPPPISLSKGSPHTPNQGLLPPYPYPKVPPIPQTKGSPPIPLSKGSPHTPNQRLPPPIPIQRFPPPQLPPPHLPAVPGPDDGIHEVVGGTPPAAAREKGGVLLPKRGKVGKGAMERK